jgi:hypothetical protein
MVEPGKRHFAGLDLGQAGQHSALAILEQTWRRVGQEHVGFIPTYTLGYLKRWPLGTRYSGIVSEVATILASPRLHEPGVPCR